MSTAAEIIEATRDSEGRDTLREAPWNWCLELPRVAAGSYRLQLFGSDPGVGLTATRMMISPWHRYVGVQFRIDADGVTLPNAVWEAIRGMSINVLVFGPVVSDSESSLLCALVDVRLDQQSWTVGASDLGTVSDAVFQCRDLLLPCVAPEAVVSQAASSREVNDAVFRNEIGRPVLPRRVQHGNVQFSDAELESYGDHWPADWTASIRVQPVDEGGLLHYVLVSREMIFEELNLGTVPCPVEIHAVAHVTPREWLTLRTWVLLHQDYPLPRTDESPAESHSMDLPRLEMLGQQFTQPLSEFNIGDAQLATMTEWPPGCVAEALLGQMLSRLRRSYRLSVVTPDGMRAVEWLHTGSNNWPITVADERALTPQEWLTLRHWIHDNQRAAGDTVLDVSPNGAVVSASLRLYETIGFEPIGRHAFRGELLLSNEELRASWPPGYRCWQREPDNLRLCRSYHLEYLEPGREPVLVEQINLGGNDCDMLPQFPNDISPEEWRNLRDWVDWRLYAYPNELEPTAAVPARSDPARGEPTLRGPRRIVYAPGLEPRDAWLDARTEWGTDSPFHVRVVWAGHDVAAYVLCQASRVVEELRLGSLVCDVRFADPHNIAPLEWLLLRRWVQQHADVDLQNGVVGEAGIPGGPGTMGIAGEPPSSATTSSYVLTYDEVTPPISHELVCLYLTYQELRDCNGVWPPGFRVVQRLGRNNPLWELKYHDITVESIRESPSDRWPYHVFGEMSPSDWLRLRQWVHSRAAAVVSVRRRDNGVVEGVVATVRSAASNLVPVRGQRVISLDTDSEDEHVG